MGTTRAFTQTCTPESLAVVIHDNCEVCGRLLQLQQAQHRGQEAIRDGSVFAGRRRQPLRAKAKVGAVQKRMCIHQDQPACCNASSHAHSVDNRRCYDMSKVKHVPFVMWRLHCWRRPCCAAFFQCCLPQG